MNSSPTTQKGKNGVHSSPYFCLHLSLVKKTADCSMKYHLTLFQIIRDPAISLHVNFMRRIKDKIRFQQSLLHG